MLPFMLLLRRAFRTDPSWSCTEEALTSFGQAPFTISCYSRSRSASQSLLSCLLGRLEGVPRIMSPAFSSIEIIFVQSTSCSNASCPSLKALRGQKSQ